MMHWQREFANQIEKQNAIVTDKRVNIKPHMACMLKLEFDAICEESQD